MGILRYYGQVLRVAFTRTPSVAQDILFAIFIIGGGVIYGLREAGMIADASLWMNEITGWQIAAIVLGAIFVVRLLLAPYWLYKEKADLLCAAEGLSAWKKMDPLRLGQAAWCWCGKCPQTDMSGHDDVYLQVEKLKRAIFNKQLEPKWGAMQWAYFMGEQFNATSVAGMGSSEYVNENTPISRAELRRYAESTGSVPDFLKD